MNKPHAYGGMSKSLETSKFHTYKKTEKRAVSLFFCMYMKKI